MNTLNFKNLEDALNDYIKDFLGDFKDKTINSFYEVRAQSHKNANFFYIRNEYYKEKNPRDINDKNLQIRADFMTRDQQYIGLNFSEKKELPDHTTIKDIFEKIQKVLHFQEKNSRKTHPNFQHILLNTLLKTQSLTPETQKILINSSHFVIFSDQNNDEKEYVLIGYENNGTKEIKLKNLNSSIFQKFFRNQYIKIKGKYYSLQIQKEWQNQWHVEIKEKKSIPIENFYVQNTIKNFHTLSHLIKNNHKIFPTLKFPKS